MDIPLKVQKWIVLGGMALLTIASVYLSLHFRINAILGIPLAAVLVLQTILDYKFVYYLLILSIPFSFAVELPGGLASDFFSEPLMWLFTLVFIVEFLSGRYLDFRKQIYGFYILVGLLLFWTFFTTLTSEMIMRSFKFFLAKLWYIAAFVAMGVRIVSNFKTIRVVFWCYFAPLIFLTLVTTVRHALHGFSFEWSNYVMQPYFQNHVIYGAVLSLMLPFAWYARLWYAEGTTERRFITFGIWVIIGGLFLSYSRSAWLSALFFPVVAVAVERKWFKRLVYLALVLVMLIIVFLVKDNNYYRFAPDYKTTIFHEGDLGKHLQATFDGSEISSMERFYRWIGAARMAQARPLIGFGPSTFSQVYKRYTEHAFLTYVSDNEDQSTTHNYFLMTFAEQGIVGGLLFIILCLFMLLKGARLYHEVKDLHRKRWLMACVSSLSIIMLYILLNELIEVDKIGAMFWLSMVFIHKIECWEDEEKNR